MFFLIFYFLILFFDFIYVYYFLDKNVLYNASGSIIDKIKNNGLKNKNNIKIRDVINIILISLIAFYINYFFTYNMFLLNSFNVYIGNKQINLLEIFEGKWKSFIFLYQVLFIIFVLIIISRVYLRYLKINQKKTEQIEETINTISIAKDSQRNNVSLEIDTLYKNVLITGSIGCGKTSGAILNICEQLIKKDIYRSCLRY